MPQPPGAHLPDGAKIPRPGSRKRQVWDAYWRGGERKASDTARKLAIKDSSFRAWLSDWRMLARGELPAWMKKESGGARAAGFAERQATFDSSGREMLRASTEVGMGGRMVIPAEMRERMHIKEGSSVILLLEGEELRVMTPMAGIRRAQRLAKMWDRGAGSVVDELLEDRRREAEEENKS